MTPGIRYRRSKRRTDIHTDMPTRISSKFQCCSDCTDRPGIFLQRWKGSEWSGACSWRDDDDAEEREKNVGTVETVGTTLYSLGFRDRHRTDSTDLRGQPDRSTGKPTTSTVTEGRRGERVATLFALVRTNPQSGFSPF